MTHADHPNHDENADYLWSRRSGLKVRVLSNCMYQQDRARVHELREGMAKAASLVAGSVALSRVVPAQWIEWCLALICAVTTLSLVFGWGAKSRDASRRATEWMALDRDIEAAGERAFTEEQLSAWYARAAEIEFGEPAMNPALWERAYLKACEALGATPGEKADKKGGLPTPAIVP